MDILGGQRTYANALCHRSIRPTRDCVGFSHAPGRRAKLMNLPHEATAHTISACHSPPLDAA